MAGMSVSWRNAARALATVAAAVLALALLPSLLRTPEPPPLDPDVGLSGVAAGTSLAGVEPRRDERRSAGAERRRQDAEHGRPERDRPERDRVGGDGRGRPAAAAAASAPASPAPVPARPPAPPPTTPPPAPPPAPASSPAPAPAPAEPQSAEPSAAAAAGRAPVRALSRRAWP